MSNPATFYRWDGTDLVLTVRVQPGASRDAIVGPREGALAVRLTAPPIEGRANARLVKLLSKAFGVSQGQVELLHGERGRHKAIRIKCPRSLPADIPGPLPGDSGAG